MKTSKKDQAVTIKASSEEISDKLQKLVDSKISWDDLAVAIFDESPSRQQVVNQLAELIDIDNTVVNDSTFSISDDETKEVDCVSVTISDTNNDEKYLKLTEKKCIADVMRYVDALINCGSPSINDDVVDSLNLINDRLSTIVGEDVNNAYLDINYLLFDKDNLPPWVNEPTYDAKVLFDILNEAEENIRTAASEMNYSIQVSNFLSPRIDMLIKETQKKLATANELINAREIIYK